MICVILVAGHAVVLEREIQEDASGKYVALTGVPKALLPARPGSEFAAIDGGDRILDCWWKTLKSRQQFSEIYLVTNADKYKHYERWATASGFPLDNIVNDGSTTSKNSLGAIADLDLVIRCKSIADDVMVVAGDMLFDDNFDIGQVLDYFKLKKGNLAIYYKMEEGESTETRGIVEVDQMTGKITRFLEKPQLSETSSRLASPVFYCLQRSSLKLVSQYTDEHLDCSERAFGLFMSWLVRNSTVYGMKLPTRFQLIGQIHLTDYEKWISVFSQKKHSAHKSESFTSRTYARVGLMGNPSDGYHGKTISFSITNFWADVTIVESSKLKLTLHPLNDPTEFGSLSDLYGISRKEGYLGGLRLLQATCKKFYEYCAKNGIALAKRNFTLKYDTNIPRQVGLAGSSAIVTSTLKCLMHFYHLTETDIPKPMQPQFVLDVETSELFITAGLQDRVIQVYQGLVYMDFSKELMEAQGHGNYECMDASQLPQLWLAYLADPSDSGKMHSNVKQRWLREEPEVVAAMKTFANLTDQAKAAIEMENYEELVSLMNQNFDLRRKIYTDRALGDANIQMIDIARKHGSAAKFTGSGGAIVGLCLDQTKKLQMMQEFRSSGFVCCDLESYCPQQPPSS